MLCIDRKFHEALASLACRAGLLQNSFHLHCCFKHHWIVFHLDLSVVFAAAAADPSALCHSLIKLSFFAWTQLFLSVIVHLSQSIHLHYLLTSNHLSTSPPNLHHLPIALFFYIFSFVFCPSVLAIECRSLMTLMKSGGRWVINHLQMSACLRSCFLVVCLCMCVCAYINLHVNSRL